MTTMLAANNKGITEDDRLKNAHVWYQRLDSPKKAAMKKQIAKTTGCDITVDDVDLLPWNTKGTNVGTKKNPLTVSKHSKKGGPRDLSDSTDTTGPLDTSSCHTSASSDENVTESEAAVKEDEAAEKEMQTQKLASQIRRLFHPDPAVVQSTLDSLQASIDGDLGISVKSLRTFERLIVATGACKDYILLLQDQLTKVTDYLPMCTVIPDLADICDEDIAAELKILTTTLKQVCNLTSSPSDPEESIRVDFTKRGCVKAVVKIMKKFPLCAEVQWDACVVLQNLLQSPEGKKRGMKAGAMKALVAAVNNHPGDIRIANDALDTLGTLIEGSFESTRLLMSMDAVTVASTVLGDWPKGSGAHTAARRLLGLFVQELQALLGKN
jgi:hypothetical protein